MKEDTNIVDYNNISQVYDVGRSANAETVKKLIRLLHVNSDSVLLDTGCGTGNYTFALKQVLKSVIGIDKSIGMIEQAHAKFPKLQFLCGDVMSLPFNSEMFNGAVAIQVLHHVERKEKFLMEAYRVLRKGGHIAIHSCSHEQMRAFWFCHYFPKCLELDLDRVPDVAVIASMLEKAEFLNVGVEICYNDSVITYETPESYLDENYRNAISTFAFLTEKDIELGCRKLQQDIASGVIKSVIQQYKSKMAIVGGSSIIYGQKV
ncbi:MAG: class I SAM-dependent methyltransferase [Candidatus Lokiarchaeia archaeon]